LIGTENKRVPMRIKRIVVPTHLFEASLPALQLAAELGKAAKAPSSF
jgi:hypothetical protein